MRPKLSLRKATQFVVRPVATNATIMVTLTLGVTRCHQVTWETGEPQIIAQMSPVSIYCYLLI